jgi:hypothetical protein
MHNNCARFIDLNQAQKRFSATALLNAAYRDPPQGR